ncbi:helix-turn-helix domain-containing protein [Streptomyces celluloflavus]|uniref:helix-turn-helix domain-containing protein n=1 Tax=Streptomyces celluloflavus TaxID=58344 RepID=UPI0036BAAB50
MRYKRPVTSSDPTHERRKGRPRRGNAPADKLDPSGPVLTTAMVAARLRLHPRTVIARARKGALPGAKLGKDWRFSRGALDALLIGKDWRKIDLPDAILTTAQVATLLGVGVDKVGRLATAGHLPHTGDERSRRFSQAAILRLLVRHPPTPST